MNELGAVAISIKELNNLIYGHKFNELISDWILENDGEFWSRGREELSTHYDQLEKEFEEANEEPNS